MHRKRLSVAALVAHVALALAFVGCSTAPSAPAATSAPATAAKPAGTSAPAAAPAGTSAPASAPATAAAPAPAASAGQPVDGGTFVTAITADPQTGNMDITSDTNAFFAFEGVFNALVWFDARGEVKPDLAQSWTISPDGLRYEFKLAPNATFHDGTPVTSEDVRFSIMDVAAKYAPKAQPVLKSVDHTELPDEHTIVFVLKQSSAVFLKGLSHGFLVILPKHIYGNGDPRENPQNATPVGSGPFKFKEWVKGDHVTLVKNDRYFKPGLPHLDQVITRVIPDAGSRTIAFQKGDVDFLGGQLIAREQVPQLSSVPGVQIDDHSGLPGEELMMFNATKKPLDDVRVREAIVRAIDLKQIAQKAFFNAGVNVPTSHIPLHLDPFHDPSAALPAYDVAKANQLLDEAGLPKGADGTRTTLHLAFSPGNDADRRSAEVVRDNLVDVGIKVAIDNFDNATIAGQVFGKGDFDLFNGSLTSNGDPELGIARFYLSTSIGTSFGNGSRYQNPEVDQLFTDGASTIDVEKRKQAYFKIQQILAKDLPTLPLADYSNIDFHRPEIGGVSETPLGYPFFNIEAAWRKKG